MAFLLSENIKWYQIIKNFENISFPFPQVDKTIKETYEGMQYIKVRLFHEGNFTNSSACEGWYASPCRDPSGCVGWGGRWWGEVAGDGVRWHWQVVWVVSGDVAAAATLPISVRDRIWVSRELIKPLNKKILTFDDNECPNGIHCRRCQWKTERMSWSSNGETRPMSTWSRDVGVSTNLT